MIKQKIVLFSILPIVPVLFGLMVFSLASIIVAEMDFTLAAAAAVTVLSSLGSAIVLVINAYSAAKDRREAAAERHIILAKADTAVAAAEVVGRKTDNIMESTSRTHELVHNTNNSLQSALEIMQLKNAELERQLAQAIAAKRETEIAQTISDMKVSMARSDQPNRGHSRKEDVKEAITESPEIKNIQQTTTQIEKNTDKS